MSMNSYSTQETEFVTFYSLSHLYFLKTESLIYKNNSYKGEPMFSIK